MRDLIVIGAGPAGVSAALYAKSRGLDVAIFEKKEIGGLIGKVSTITHYTGIKTNESGLDFARQLKEQLVKADIKIVEEEVIELIKDGDEFKIVTKFSEYRGKKVIIATGSTPKDLPISLPEELKTSHWALGYEEIVRRKTVVVNGGSDGACKEALYLAQFAKEVHIIEDADRLLCINEFKKQIDEAKNITVHTNTIISDIVMYGKKAIEVVLEDGENIKSDRGIEIFVMIGQYGNSDLVDNALDIKDTFVKSDIKTKVNGLFIAGDIREKSIRQVATAVSDGCIAGIMASK